MELRLLVGLLGLSRDYRKSSGGGKWRRVPEVNENDWKQQNIEESK